MTDKDRVYGMLGLAARAGKIVSGSDAVTGAIRSGNVELLIITKDISRNSLDKILKNMGSEEITKDISRNSLDKILKNMGSGEITCYSFGTSEDLGFALGKPDRTVAAITDKSFAEGISAILENINEEEDT